MSLGHRLAIWVLALCCVYLPAATASTRAAEIVATPFTCARYGYALDLQPGWHVDPQQGVPAADCSAVSITQNKSFNQILVLLGTRKDTPRGLIDAQLRTFKIQAKGVRYTTVIQHGTTFTVVQTTFSGRDSGGKPFQGYLLLGSAMHRGLPLLFLGAVNLRMNPDAAPQTIAVKRIFASFRLI